MSLTYNPRREFRKSPDIIFQFLQVYKRSESAKQMWRIETV